MRKPLLSLILAAVPLMALAEADQTAADLPGTGAEDPHQARGRVADLALAHALFALGKAQGDALTLIAAANMAAEAAAAPGPELKRETSGPVAAEPAGELPEAPLDAGDIFARAEALAGDDPLLLELIEAAKAASAESREPHTGPGAAFFREAELQPGRTDTWEIPRAAGEYAEISVLASGSQALNFALRDEEGQLICSESAPADQIYCGFLPAGAGVFYLSVENTGTTLSRYVLLTN